MPVAAPAPLPAAYRRGFEALGGLGPVVCALREMVLLPLLRPGLFERLGLAGAAPPRWGGDGAAGVCGWVVAVPWVSVWGFVRGFMEHKEGHSGVGSARKSISVRGC